MRPRARDAGVHEGVEHPPLGLAQSRHHRHRHRGEQHRLATALGAPCDLAVETLLGLPGDGHPPLTRVLAEPRDPACGRVRGGVIRRRQRTDDQDLVAVDGDDGRNREPVFGQPPAEPTNNRFTHYMITLQSTAIGKDRLHPAGQLPRVGGRRVADKPLTDVRRTGRPLGQQRRCPTRDHDRSG